MQQTQTDLTARLDACQLAQRLVSHRIGELAREKCLSCRHGEYRPFTPGHVARYVAFQPEAIRCQEGIHTFAPRQRYGGSYHGFAALPALKRPWSKIRNSIVSCEFWEAKA